MVYPVTSSTVAKLIFLTSCFASTYIKPSLATWSLLNKAWSCLLFWPYGLSACLHNFLLKKTKTDQKALVPSTDPTCMSLLMSVPYLQYSCHLIFLLVLNPMFLYNSVFSNNFLIRPIVPPCGT